MQGSLYSVVHVYQLDIWLVLYPISEYFDLLSSVFLKLRKYNATSCLIRSHQKLSSSVVYILGVVGDQGPAGAPGSGLTGPTGPTGPQGDPGRIIKQYLYGFHIILIWINNRISHIKLQLGEAHDMF